MSRALRSSQVIKDGETEALARSQSPGDMTARVAGALGRKIAFEKNRDLRTVSLPRGVSVSSWSVAPGKLDGAVAPGELDGAVGLSALLLQLPCKSKVISRQND